MEQDPNKMTLVQRYKAPTPPLFKKLTTIGIILTAVGAALTQGDIIDINPIFESIGGYMLTGGAVLTAISKATVNGAATK